MYGPMINSVPWKNGLGSYTIKDSDRKNKE